MKGFRRRRGGRVTASMQPLEARMLATFAGQVIELLYEDAGSLRPTPADNDPLEALVDLSGPVSPPEDPVLVRLLPDAYRDDDESAADFRRFTETSLRADKVANARLLLETLRAGGFDDSTDDSTVGSTGAESEPGAALATVEVELDPPQVQAWLRSLTDMRLALATRLGIEDEDDEQWADMSEDDPRAVMHDVYGWLGFVQESLVQALS